MALVTAPVKPMVSSDIVELAGVVLAFTEVGLDLELVSEVELLPEVALGEKVKLQSVQVQVEMLR